MIFIPTYKSLQCESLQLELQQWKEKAEELSLDLQILKEDIATPGSCSCLW